MERLKTLALWTAALAAGTVSCTIPEAPRPSAAAPAPAMPN